MARAWLTRAGKHGEREMLALDEKLAVIGWAELPVLAQARTREDLAKLLRQAFPDAGDKRLVNHLGQLWAVRETMAVDDVLQPLFDYLRRRGSFVDLDNHHPEHLSILSRDVLRRIAEGSDNWRAMVPDAVADLIVKRSFFGHRRSS